MVSRLTKLASVVFQRNAQKLNWQTLQTRSSSYNSSPMVSEIKTIDAKYEVTSSPEDWKYVERLLPIAYVPSVTPKSEYPSGWKPSTNNLKEKPFYVGRNKNHMLPVYLRIAQFGIRRVTIVRNIQGDIWLLEKQLRGFLEPQQTKPLSTQVNEFTGFIRIYGDHVNAIKYWLEKRGY